MKKTRLLLASLLLGMAMSGTAQDFADHTLSFNEIVSEWSTQEFFTVGNINKPDIKAYFLSFAMAYPNRFLNEMVAKVAGVEGDMIVGNYVLDPRNGYIRATSMAQFETTLQMCYWRLGDDILVGVSLEGHDEGVMAAETEEEYDQHCYNGMMFYRIKKGEALWEPRTLAQVTGQDFHLPDYKIELPQHGKDIRLTFSKEDKYGYDWLLRWNGHGFTPEKL